MTSDTPADPFKPKHAEGYAVWEIHPVMKMEVVQRNTGDHRRQSQKASWVRAVFQPSILAVPVVE